MIGLEYIIKANGIEFREIAHQLNISPKTINDWTKGRKAIPIKRVKELMKYFDLAEDLFQKELNNLDKIKVHQKIIETLEGNN